MGEGSTGAGASEDPRRSELEAQNEELRRIQNALRESEALYRSVVEDQTEFICRYRADGRLTFVNGAYARYYGKSREELLGSNFIPIIPESDMALIRERQAGIARETPMVAFEHRIVLPGGEVRWQQWTHRGEYAADGSLLEYQAVGRDVTENKQAEEALRRSEARARQTHAELEWRVQERTADLAQLNEFLREEKERFRTVADCTWDWEYWQGPNGEIRYMAPSCERVTGYTDAAFQSRPVLLNEIVHPEDRALYEAHLAEYDQSPRPGRIDYRIVTGSGEVRWIAHECQAVFGTDGSHRGRRISGRDITERKDAEARRDQLEAHLRQNDKLAVIGQLAGGMAHDFNNLLAAIMSSVEMAQRNRERAAEVQRHCDAILDTVERGAELIRQLMSFARKGQYVRTCVDLCDLVRQVNAFLRRTVDRLIHVEVCCPSSPVVVLGDPAQLQAALMNLAVNARDAMPQGGVLLLEVSRIELDAAFCAIRPGLAAVWSACLQVRDTGTGMTPETLEHLFEPFFTTKVEGKGTGLGLASVFGTVKSHNGYIAVETAPGQGTAFTIYLPLAPESAPSPQDGGGSGMVAGQGCILLADDEPVIRRNAAGALVALGYEVLEAADGREALERYRENPARVDLVILDMIMPVLNGWDAFQEIRRIRPDARVLFASGYADAPLVEKARAAGVCGFVEKPVRQERLSQAVAEALR